MIVMEQYTIEERRTILYVLTEVMMADGVLHPSEQLFFDEIFDAIGADVVDLTAMEHIDNEYALGVFHKMDSHKQGHFKKVLHSMAMADGVFDPRERNVLRYFDAD